MLTGNSSANIWLAAAFVIGFFAVGLPYWQVPYSKVSLPSTLYGLGLLAVGILAAAVRLLSDARLGTVILVIGAAVPAAVLVRVVVETANNPTSHNLWPFELVIAAVVGLVCSSAGTIAGSLLSVFSRQ
jgi:hypothetical protein